MKPSLEPEINILSYTIIMRETAITRKTTGTVVNRTGYDGNSLF